MPTYEKLDPPTDGQKIGRDAQGKLVVPDNPVIPFIEGDATAPKYAGQEKVNPGSVILSGAMMFEHLGWNEAGRLIEHGVEQAILQKKVTYDFERQMEGATKVSCSGFGDVIIANIENS